MTGAFGRFYTPIQNNLLALLTNSGNVEIMEFYLIWFSFSTIMLLAVASPGPDFVITVRNAVLHSQRIGIFTAIGIGLGICVHLTYSILGIAALISQSVMLFNLIKISFEKR